ncbi:hypothetical protein AMTRI_Chr04g187570 [Amborella trichopoda]
MDASGGRDHLWLCLDWCCTKKPSYSMMKSWVLPLCREGATISKDITTFTILLQRLPCGVLCLIKSFHLLFFRNSHKKQPRFRLEIPVIGETPQSLTGIAVELFKKIRIKSNVYLFSLSDRALEPFQTIKNVELSAMKVGNQGGFSRLGDVVLVEAVCIDIDAKLVLIFNPKWGFDEESDFGRMGSYISSFEVIYSFMGLEVRGALSKRRGVVFKGDNGGWEVLMEDEGELKMVSRFKKMPSTMEVENVLYNLMAMNSPLFGGLCLCNSKSGRGLCRI